MASRVSRLRGGQPVAAVSLSEAWSALEAGDVDRAQEALRVASAEGSIDLSELERSL